MKEINDSLEYKKIEDKLLSYFTFLENKDLFVNTPMIKESKVLQKEHDFLNEIVSYFTQGYVINLLEVNDLSPYFKALERDGNLSIKGLSDFRPFLDDIALFDEAFKNKDSLENIYDLVYDLKTFTFISKSIDHAILPDLTIADDASELLYLIRQKIKKVSDSISYTIKELAKNNAKYLAETKETMKDGLPTLAVKNSYKNYVKGIVADISNTGNTIYIVPLEIIEINNQIYELKEKERIEEERIVKALSELIKQDLAALMKDYEICIKLDSLISRVRFGFDYKGAVAEISNNIYLEDLAHLLLPLDTVVRNTVSLGEDKPKIIVISGPNAGGKTVIIKAVTLACYMNQKGMLVATLGKAQLRLFDNFFFIAGDGQSIMDNLSTFSGHIQAINEAIKYVTKDSLFVVDEIGQGTSPLDGEAIGCAVIDYIEKIGSYSILTSHYEGLKQKAINDDKVLISAMIFNEETIKPTFKYKEGIIGKSYAIEVAVNLGMNSEIVDSAKKYIDSSLNTPEKIMIDKLTKLQDENEKLKITYENKIKSCDELTKKRESAIEALKLEKIAIKEKADKKIQEIVDEKIKEINEIYHSNKGKLDLPTYSKIKGNLNSLKKQESIAVTKTKAKAKPELGNYVRVFSINNMGYVKKLSKDSLSVDINGILLKTSFDDIEVLPDPKNIINRRKVASIDKVFSGKTGVSLECNLIGLHVDEAKEKLEKYIDDCLLMKYHEVRIIHGHGTGALREMVKDFCAKNKNVKATRFGDTYEGGVGATVVSLK